MITSWRVYANNCTVAGNGIQEIGAFTVAETIQKILDHAAESELLPINGDTDKDYEDAFIEGGNKLEKAFYNDGEILQAGDFYIVRSEEKPTERPDCCGWSTEIL